LFPGTTTGEGATLNDEETDRVADVVIEQANHRALVIVGSGHNSTKKAIQSTRRAKRLGADGGLSVAPYCNKPIHQGFYEHLKGLAESEGFRIVVYNVPGRTGSKIEPHSILRLAELPNVVPLPIIRRSDASAILP